MKRREKKTKDSISTGIQEYLSIFIEP